MIRLFGVLILILLFAALILFVLFFLELFNLMPKKEKDKNILDNEIMNNEK